MKRVYIDMDNVLVDFGSGLAQISNDLKNEYAGRLDEIPGLFGLMKPMEGAIDAVHELQKHYDLFILSTAPWKNPSAWADKVKWVTEYLDDVFHKKMVISHRKDLCQGDYLIDDRGKNGTSEFRGKWIEFGSKRFPDWDSVVKYLRARLNKSKDRENLENLAFEFVKEGYGLDRGQWAYDLATNYPHEVIDAFCSNPMEVMSDLEDMWDCDDYEDSESGLSMSWADWSAFFSTDAATIVYSKLIEEHKSRQRYEERAEKLRGTVDQLKNMLDSPV